MRPANIYGFVRLWNKEQYRCYLLYNIGRKNAYLLHIPYLKISIIKVKDLDKMGMQPVEVNYNHLLKQIEEKEKVFQNVGRQYPHNQLVEIKHALKEQGLDGPRDAAVPPRQCEQLQKQ